MAKMRAYKDFKLWLSGYKESGSFEVRLSGDQFGEIKEKSKLKLDEDSDVATYLARLEANGELREDKLVALGKALAKSLFPGEFMGKFTAAVKACGENEGIRLRLVIEDAALQQVPWEYTWVKINAGDDTRDHCLVLNPAVSLVRHPATGDDIPALTVKDPALLRLQVAFAQPKDQDKLDLALEKEVLEDSLKKMKADKTRVEMLPVISNATFKLLEETLLAEKPEMFHYAGHGEFGENDANASLVLVDDEKKSSRLSAPVLAKALDAAGVRLAYLGACLTSRVQGDSPWTSVANQLVANGVPAVIAMQYKVNDSAATRFCSAFYSILAAGLSVDEAVYAGRLAVFNDSDGSNIQWGIPTLYLRARDGVLFQQVSEQKSKVASEFTAAVKQIVKHNKKGGKMVGIDFSGKIVPGKFDVIQDVDVNEGDITGVSF